MRGNHKPSGCTKLVALVHAGYVTEENLQAYAVRASTEHWFFKGGAYIQYFSSILGELMTEEERPNKELKGQQRLDHYVAVFKSNPELANMATEYITSVVNKTNVKDMTFDFAVSLGTDVFESYIAKLRNQKSEVNASSDVETDSAVREAKNASP